MVPYRKGFKDVPYVYMYVRLLVESLMNTNQFLEKYKRCLKTVCTCTSPQKCLQIIDDK